MALIIKVILPGLPKNPARAMHKLVRDTLDIVRSALEQQKGQSCTAQSTRPSRLASLPDNEIKITSGRFFFHKPSIVSSTGWHN